MNKNRGSAVLAVILAVVLIAIAVFVYIQYKSPAATTENNTVSPTPSSTVSVKSPSASPITTSKSAPVSSWKRYSFKGSIYLPAMSFEYPSNWSVTEYSYKTSVEESAGLPGEVASLSVKPLSGGASEDVIVIGGYKATCGFAIYGQSACLGKNTPIRTISNNSKVQAVLIHIVASFR